MLLFSLQYSAWGSVPQCIYVTLPTCPSLLGMLMKLVDVSSEAGDAQFKGHKELLFNDIKYTCKKKVNIPKSNQRFSL